MKLGAAEPLIEEVSSILVENHPSGKEKGLEFQCVHDADRMVTLEDEQKLEIEDLPSPPEMTGNTFFTESGRKMAREVLRKA